MKQILCYYHFTDEKCYTKEFDDFPIITGLGSRGRRTQVDLRGQALDISI